MNTSTLQQAYTDLFNWCRERDFAGYDPFDALNSRFFQATPLKYSRVCRLAWTQLLKRSPLNLRPLALVPKERNAKGIALFALAALSEHRRTRTQESANTAESLLGQLLLMRLTSASGAAWGYNFDWQSRVLFAPRGTPTIVPTAFVARALMEAHEVFGYDHYLTMAQSICDFISKDLPRTVENEQELCFSYSPNSSTRVYNASLLAAETLATVAAKTGETQLAKEAIRATRYVINQQRADGSWAYGAERGQSWVDNFHTAFLLSSLQRTLRHLPTNVGEEFVPSLQRGFEFWRSRFFLADGWPKYYDDALYPVDTHAAATAIATLADLHQFSKDPLTLAMEIADWSIANLRDKSGHFYYQRRRFYTVRTPFMRWSEAWMLYGLARLLEEQGQTV